MSENVKRKNWVAALVLCWFLGVYGAHRFYTGKSNTAWVMVVLAILGFTLPISVIWSIVDGFTIALGNFTDIHGNELEERIPWLGYTYMAVVILGVLGSFLYFSVIAAIVTAILANGAITP